MAILNENGTVSITYNTEDLIEVDTQIFFDLFDDDLIDEEAEWIAGYDAWRAFIIGRSGDGS